MLTLAAMPQFLIFLLVMLFVIVSVMMMLVVLIQRPQGGGLSEAFGSGSGSGHTAFGAKTGDALTTATIGIFVLFIGFAIGLNYIVKPPQAVEIAAPAVQPGPPVPPGGSGAPAQGSAENGVQAVTIDPATGQSQPIKLEKIPPPTGAPSRVPVPAKPSEPPDGGQPATQPPAGAPQQPSHPPAPPPPPAGGEGASKPPQ